MLRSLYSGVSGMRGFQTKLDVIGNNIANVNTVGFKKSRVMFQDILSQNISGATAPTDDGIGGVNPRQVGLGSTVAAIDVVHSPGSPMMTNLISDLAIEGDGFFIVSPTQDGEPFYLTRAGNFTRDANGFLVTSQGYYVMDDSGSGPIEIPRDQYVSYSIGKNGVVTGTTPEGTNEEIGTIGVGVVSNPGGLKKVGNSLFELTPNAHPDGEFEVTTPAEANSSIISGQLEMSNVDLTEEFTEMIVAQRGFQANSRIITTSDSILEEVVNLKR
ncbi:flagellar basal body rod protein FlgG [Brevibacillus sp. B_LB10_24]|uniref:flagellar basal body rod protein FlgG n=1 Tax=Brevibacillus sp. B_LB10_24 TaxID=3380645 RepID=UPI0038B91ED0